MKITIGDQVVYNNPAIVNKISVGTFYGGTDIAIDPRFQDVTINLQLATMALAPLDALGVEGFVALEDMTEDKVKELTNITLDNTLVITEPAPVEEQSSDDSDPAKLTL